MTERSNQAVVRNPLLTLPSVRRINELPPEAQALLVDILAEIGADARARAQRSWIKNKGPMAAYWKAVGAYAEHLRRAAKRAQADALDIAARAA